MTVDASPVCSSPCTSIAVDSNGNIYTTETYEGSRIQKFVYTGMGPVPAGAEGMNSQGVLWPADKR